jgi:hypothetical protein
MRFLVVAVLLAGACGSGSKAQPPDMAYSSSCGFPGDKGNELGVGLFCQSLSSGECSGNGMAGLCSSLGDPTSHFCTFVCHSTDPPGTCGSGAVCVCQSGLGCGCTPVKCAPVDGGP